MMKNHILPVLATGFLIITQFTVQAQVVTLVNDAQEVVNGTTITVEAPAGALDQVLGMSLSAANNNSAAHMVNVKRYELSVLHGTGNYFCWDVCYGERASGSSPLWIAADPIQMGSGDVANGFHAYYKPQSNTGVSTFRYVWYDLNNSNDSTWVDFVFNVTAPAGVTENASAVSAFNVFPNPSTGGDITINYDLATATAGTELAVYNVLGERKLVRNLGAVQGKVTLRDGELASGVWFAVLERNGKALATKRVVVAR